MKQELGIAGRLAHAFLNSKLTPLFIAASLAMGIFAVAVIPREEDPQILVPMLDITTAMPGASPAEVEQPGDRAFSGRHAAGRCAHQGL
jgi:hypothetical protein